MARPASRFRPVRVTPRQGGQLLTNGISAEEAGFQNYTIKRDWRRDQTDEMRREGFDLFQGNLKALRGNQPFPGTQVLTGMTKEAAGLLQQNYDPLLMQDGQPILLQ